MHRRKKKVLQNTFVLKVEIRKLNDDIKGKNEQISLLEKQIADSIAASHNKMDKLEISQVSSVSKSCTSSLSVITSLSISC